MPQTSKLTRGLVPLKGQADMQWLHKVETVRTNAEDGGIVAATMADIALRGARADWELVAVTQIPDGDSIDLLLFLKRPLP